jgi:hypothetical protein
MFRVVNRLFGSLEKSSRRSLTAFGMTTLFWALGADDCLPGGYKKQPQALRCAQMTELRKEVRGGCITANPAAFGLPLHSIPRFISGADRPKAVGPTAGG